MHHQDASDEPSESNPRTVSKFTFGCLTWTLFFVFQIAGTVVLVRFGIRRERFGVVLLFLNFVLSRVAADRILKLMGRSRSRITVEETGRTLALAEGEVRDDEVVEVRYPSSFITGLGVLMLIPCALTLWVALTAPAGKVKGIAYVYAIFVFSGLGFLYCLYERLWGKPKVRADASGITSYPASFLIRLFVPWSDVAKCEIVTAYDTFGKPVFMRPFLKGWNDEALIAMDFQYTKVEDQERLVRYIKAKLPRAVDELGE
jgi:hypothetical protein